MNGVMVEKNNNLKNIKLTSIEKDAVAKKCGFKKIEGFDQQHIFKTKFNNIKYNIEVYGKVNGRANSENKYDYPPPIDNTLFYGNMMLLCKINDDYANQDEFNVDVWKKIYTRLFGGFYDLSKCANEDENEEDELENIPNELKTKEGYLKDGFIVDEDDDEDNDQLDNYTNDEQELSNDSEDELSEGSTIDIDSELSEEEYMLYSDED